MTAPQQVAAEVSGPPIYGYDFTPDGSTLYGLLDNPPSLITVNQATGAPTTVGPMPRGPTEHWTDLTIDPITGRAYATTVADNVTSYAMYTVDLATGATTLIASVGASAMPIDMSMNCEGVLYAETLGTSGLYRVNPASAQMTLVGPLGAFLQGAQGMDFDNATGVLHAWLYGGSNTNYSSINVATGAATPFAGTEPPGQFEGAIKSECSPPTASVTSGPTGKTADLRPAFGFATTYAARAECSLDRGTPAFGPCTAPSYQPASALAPGGWTFRVRGVRGAHVAEATRAFQVVDCAGLKAKVAKAEAGVQKARKALTKAKKSGNAAKIKAARKKTKKANKALKAARAVLAAEPVCG